MGELDLSEIRPADETMMNKIGMLRIRAWESFYPEIARLRIWLEDLDRSAMHWAILRDGEPVAAARMSIHETLDSVPDSESYRGAFREPLPSPIASFNRLVVEPSSRKQGLSRRLDLARMDAARRHGCRIAIGYSSVDSRISRLEELGWFIVGPGKQSHVFSHRAIPTILARHHPGPPALGLAHEPVASGG
ncbi:GNAT family N-acetyltransferase [Paludisphaera sp.]|uniref:GNAT family N-acetyltransferase n=1 Tax=Paludisphaera sp. TaxID=2017432 RepID=UPI00301BA2BA